MVLNEYELVKRKASKNFETVEQICQAFKVQRKDIRKYYERWVKSGRDRNALLPLKRGPKLGQLKILSKDEERTIVKIERFWKTLNNECIRLQRVSQTKQEFIAELNGFMYRYNYKRRHSALKYGTPLEKLRFVTEILK